MLAVSVEWVVANRASAALTSAALRSVSTHPLRPQAQPRLVAANRRRLTLMTIPWCTYCDPEIAHVGMHVWDASERSVPIKSFTVMMQDVARAITDGQDDGFIKIHVKLGTDKILGATIVAARASEMINEISVAMSTGIGMRKLARVLHTYPAQSDAIRLAALAYTLDEPVSWLQKAYARWFA
jgi:pyruvate/2-oxoglutarate dehydrogenase complex dihydrolipoamide dehydrogenase (E3) component